MPRYDTARIEAKWQANWERRQTFVTPQTPPANSTGKLYVLDMFPYPSGNGLHVGHPEGYTATDIVCRYNRMRGKHVLHPMGWDAFGLPAEDYAIKTGTHPAVTTQKNIDTFRSQLKMLGFSYDWTREFATTDPDYYRWTQWIFLQLFDTWFDPDHEWVGPDGRSRRGKGRPISELPIPPAVQAAGTEAVRRYQDQRRLAYQSEAPVNWCPALGTVLANEEVVDGKSERGGHPVERLPLRQWMLRITAYADRLLSELDFVNWSESIKLLQRNWIGRSTGAEVDFYIGPPEQFATWKAGRAQPGFPTESSADVLRVYTTRPDTLFGVTYMVIAPEHPFVDRLTTPTQAAAVDQYRRQAATKSDLDRTELNKDKTGVFTGSYAINPVNGKQVPIWVADYVLISYGTGAIMAVPAHDLRDWEFAVKFQIPIQQVVQSPEGYQPDREEQTTFDAALARGEQPIGFTSVPIAALGTAINSGPYDGLESQAFKQRITADLAQTGLGKEAVNFRLRDWLFSRQRYWGEPFPVWHELDAQGQPTGLMRTDDPADLPIRLPEMADFKPTGTPEPMLSKAPAEWLYRTAADGTRLKRETNSMPQWAGSCWYYMRFADPKNSAEFLASEIANYWLPVDLYIGGAEHAVLHLLYARFWHKVLFDRGFVTVPEPFQRLVNQGMILGEAEITGYARKQLCNAASANGTDTVLRSTDVPAAAWVSLKDTREAKNAAGETIRVHEQSGDELVEVALAPEEMEKKGDALWLAGRPEIAVESRAFKMSKSRGNVINPNDVVESYGADSLRLYEMFMGPLEQVKPWNMNGVQGIYRFLGRVWRLFVEEHDEQVQLSPAVQNVPPSTELDRLLHKTIKAVTDDIERLAFNTAISRMMEFTTALTALEVRPRALLEPFVLLLSPFAPHLAEEAWELLGHAESLAYEPWPNYDPAKLVEAEVEIPVQINGKLRAKLLVPVGADQPTIESLAAASQEIQQQLAGKTIVKTVVVPGRMLNYVVK